VPLSWLVEIKKTLTLYLRRPSTSVRIELPNGEIEELEREVEAHRRELAEIARNGGGFGPELRQAEERLEESRARLREARRQRIRAQ
jgi:chromosome segregation ATPase